MGVFLNVLAAPGASKEELMNLFSAVDPKTAESWNLNVSQCRLWQADKGAAAMLSDFCSGYEEMTFWLSCMRNGPLMLCYIYDDDAWGYYFYDRGCEVDSFCTVPDLLQEANAAERLRLTGCSAALSPYFQVRPEQLDPYLTFWGEDEGDAWQMADFLSELGFALPPEEEDDEQNRSRDYEQLVFLAEHNSPDSWDEASLISFCEIIELYRMEHLPEKPTSDALIQRNLEDLRMLGCFLQQFSLPDSLYRLIWQTLELRYAKYGRAAVLYGTLRKQLLDLLPDLAELSNPPYDALRVELIRSLNGRDESRQTLDTLFARPDFNAAFWDDTFVLKNFVRKQPYLDLTESPLFLERICEFYGKNPDAPYAVILMTRFQNMLKILRDKQRRKEEELEAVPSKVPELSSIPFFLYWLNTFCGMMDLPELRESLYRQVGFELDWGRKFVGTDAKTGLPGCKKLVFTWNKQRFQIRFHLRYLEYIWDGKTVTQPCFFLEDLMKLKNADRFFYLLPLMVPVEDTDPLAREIERRLADAVPFLTGAECGTLASQMAKGFVFYPELEDPVELLLDWIWDSGETEPGIDLEENCPAELEAMFEEPVSIEKLLSRIQDFCNQQPGDFTCWLSGTVQVWLETQKARKAMSEEEKLAEFLHSLPQKVFWESREKFFLYRCIEHQNRLYPNIFCQNPDTGVFAPVGAVQEFLEEAAQNEPASDALRKKLLNCALGFSMDLQNTSYVSELVYLPQAVYITPDPTVACCTEISALPRFLCESEITSKRLDELIKLYHKGALLRLELCWGGCAVTGPNDTVYIPMGAPISLVLMRDGDKWACFCFDDAGHDANQLISDPKGYLTSDAASMENIPFALGSVPVYSVFRRPEDLLEKLPILFRSVSSARPNFQCNGMWSMISGFFYNREKYILDKRTLGGFPPERAHNQLTTRFYLKEYPTALDALPEHDDVQHLDISGGNRDMTGFYLSRFFQNGLKKLIFHFGAKLHLIFLRDSINSMMVLLDDTECTSYFAVADSSLAPSNPAAKVKAISFLGQPTATGLLFSKMIILRSSADLLFACWKNRKVLLADSRQFCTEDPCRLCSYETLQAELLALC